MGLRMILVGLVASLGFELPTGDEVAGWVQSGRSWARAQAAAWDAPMPNGVLAFAPEAAVPSPGELARSIAAERAAESSPAAAARDEVAAYEPFDVDAAAAPGLVDALNGENEGLTGFAATDAAAEEPALTPAGDDRLALAVRLTGEAVRAWASVLRGPVVVSVQP